jgi:hypothetical protein
MVVPPAWDEAGFTDIHSGRLGRMVPSGHVIVPASVELDGHFLVWQYWGAHGPPKTYIPSGDVLNGFVRLWKGTPSDETIRPEIDRDDTPTQREEKYEAYRKTLEARLPAARDRTLKFARKYGVLMLDEKGDLASHWVGEGVGPLLKWWRISRKACAFLNVAAALNIGRVGDSEDWSFIDPSVGPEFPRSPNPYISHGVAAARQRFEYRFKDWLTFARITFGLTSMPKPTQGSAWRTEIHYGGRVFSAIVLQLLLTLVNADGLYFCSGCALPYLRPKTRKKPNRGEANFCGTCGKGNKEALRQADRRRREKMAEARRLHAEGAALKEIAQRLETTTDSVRRWIKKGK